MRALLASVVCLLACRGGGAGAREPLAAVELVGVPALSGRTQWIYVERGGCYVAHGEECEGGACLTTHRGACLEHTPGVGLWGALQALAPDASGMARVVVDPAVANERTRVITETFAGAREWQPPRSYGFRIVRAQTCDGGFCPPRVLVWYHTRLTWTCTTTQATGASASRPRALAAERTDPSFSELENWFLTRPQSNHTIELSADCRMTSGDPQGLALWRRVAAHLPESCRVECAPATP